MATRKSFNDNIDIEQPWAGTTMPTINSISNSQIDTLFDVQSQPSFYGDNTSTARQQPNVSQSEENRRLHQDHKSIKRSIDRTSQEFGAAFASLHEKLSKTNLSISDLHSDLKRLERAVIFDNENLRPSVIDTEIKITNMVHGMESKLLSGITHCISNALDLKISNLSSQIDNKLKEISTAICESNRPNDSSLAEEIKENVNTISTLVCTIQKETNSIKYNVDSMKTRIEELGSSPEKSVAVIPATTVPVNANTPLQLLPPPPLPPLQSAPIADQSVLQPVSISDSEFAGTLCIMVWGCVREQRTSCGSAFAIAETMRKVDSQWPFTLVDGWPTAIEASSVTSASSLSRKRQKTRR